MKVGNSQRLSYQLMTRADAELLFQLDQDPEVMRYINGGHMTTMKEIVDISLPRMESYRNEQEGWGLWKVVVRETEYFIGWILVRPMEYFSDAPEFDNIELGWRFMRSSWGKGYATEAAASLRDAIAENSKVKKITAVADEKNTASIQVMGKLGMRYLKTQIYKDPLGDAEAVYYELELG